MRYPPATWKGDGVSGGSYVELPWRVVLHTTETRGVPGYNDGLAAPHLTYTGTGWVQHTALDTAARALRNESGGVETNRANCLQVEIVCYSSKPTADKYGGLWVGDLNTRHLDDIKAFLMWCSQTFGVKMWWPGKQAFSYAEANADGFRMSNVEWLDFDGVCGHQHVPENTHWDPGAFNWHYLNLATEDDMTPLQARLELASAWHSKSGVWMSPTGTEDPQARLTRLALEVAGNVRTVADIVAFAPVGTPKNEPVPAWVLDPAVPYSVLPSMKLPDEEVVRLIRS